MINRKHPDPQDWFDGNIRIQEKQIGIRRWENREGSWIPPSSVEDYLGNYVFTFYALFDNKCVYCEQILGSGNKGVIARFRPPEGATQSRSATGSSSHYGWLVWDWKNLYLTCTDCSRNKGNQFPVEGRRAALGIHDDDLKNAEHPLLLNPCDMRRNPLHHLLFKSDGTVVWRQGSIYGESTVRILDLNRQNLIDARQSASAELQDKLTKALSITESLDRNATTKAVEELEVFCDNTAPFAGMKRQILQGLLEGERKNASVELRGKLRRGAWERFYKWLCTEVEPPPIAPILSREISEDGTHFSYGHALIIGVGSYHISSLSVPTTANDAQQIAALLRNRQVAAYPPTQVQVLSGKEATRDGILAALDRLEIRLRNANRPTVVLHFAGHGKQIGDQFYLLPYDYDPTTPQYNAIDALTFRTKVQSIAMHAQKLLVLLNCCHAGGFGDNVLDENTMEGDTPPREFYLSLVEGSGQVLISSSRPEQKSSAESKSRPSLTSFGAQFANALSGNAPGSGQTIGVLGLFAYLSTSVPLDAKHITYRGQPLEQNPLLWAQKVDGDFPIAIRPAKKLSATLSANQQHVDDLLKRLAEIETELAKYNTITAAPSELLNERNILLRHI